MNQCFNNTHAGKWSTRRFLAERVVACCAGVLWSLTRISDTTADFWHCDFLFWWVWSSGCNEEPQIMDQDAVDKTTFIYWKHTATLKASNEHCVLCAQEHRHAGTRFLLLVLVKGNCNTAASKDVLGIYAFSTYGCDGRMSTHFWPCGVFCRHN